VAPPQGQLKASRYFVTLFLIIAVLWAWVIFFNDGVRTPKLGLDLQGGTSLTLEATSRGSAPDPRKLEEARDIIANRVNDYGVSEAEVLIEGDRNIVINVPGATGQDLKRVGAPAELRFREVLQTTDNVSPDDPSPSPSGSASPAPSGSASASPGLPTGSATPSGSAKPSGSASPNGSASASPSPTDPSVEELKRLAYTAVGNGDAKQGEQLVSQIPEGIKDPKDVAEQPQAMAFLAPFGKLPPEQVAVLPPQVQFKVPTITCKQLNGRPPASIVDAGSEAVACDAEGGAKYLLAKSKVLGTDVDEADFTFDPQRSQWIVTLSFNSDGQNRWTNLTAETKDKQVAVVLDNEVVSAPTIQERIAGDAEITGSFTRTEAQNLAAQLRYGALPLTFAVQNQFQITPTLGLDQMQAGLLAGLIGVILVIIYCFIYYRALGLVVILSLLASAAIVYSTIVLLGTGISFTLTLAGIAGFIVAIGITADSFVVFFERLKDEVKEGRTVRSAVPRAWVRARRTILSANTVSILAAAVLYFLAVGAVKGFAFTLGLSALIDLLIVFMFTHPLVAVLSRARIFTSPRISGLGNMRPDPDKSPARVRGVRTKES
jgi:preprotein translocase subunit SecD